MENTFLLDEEQSSNNYGTLGSINNENLHDLVIFTDNEIPHNAEAQPSISFSEVFKRLSALAIPMGCSFTFSFEVFLTGLLLQLLSESEEETAAATLVSIWMNTVCGLFMAPLFAVAINLSGKLGAWRAETELTLEMQEATQEVAQIWEPGDTRERKKEKIESTNISSLLIAGMVTIPATLLLYYSAPILTSVFGQNKEVALIAQKFLRPYSVAALGLMGRIGTEQIMFSFGKTQPAMWMALTNFFIGSSLSVFLSFGIKSGSLVIPWMSKEAGVATGFIVESYLTFLSYGLFVKFNKECREFDFYKISIERIRRNLSGLKDILRLGGAITFTIATELALTLSVGIFSGLVGTEQQSAMSYCIGLINFEFIFMAAFSLSCTQEIRRELGAKKFRIAEKIGKYGVLTALIYLTPIPVIFAVYPKALEVIFGGASEPVSSILKILVPVMSAGVILDSVRYNLLQQTRALDDLLVPNVITFIGISGGIGLSAGLGLGTTMGIYGIATGYTLGLGATAGMTAWRWMNDLQKLLQEEDNTPLEQETSIGRRLLACSSSFFCCSRNHLTARINSVSAIRRADIFSTESSLVFAQ